MCVGQRFVATAAEECRPSGVDQLIRQLNDLGILSRASGTHGRERERQTHNNCRVARWLAR